MDDSLRSLYVCYLSLDDPLVQTQVVAYLEGLVRRGHTVHLLTFEPELDSDQRRAIEADLTQRGIAWHPLRYHKRPSLPATVYDTVVGAFAAVRLVRRHHLEAIHARSHVPAAMALIARRISGCRFIFDIRGLMAEEYADAGRWRPGGIPFRLTKRIERAAIRRADARVVLTERVRGHLFGAQGQSSAVVIPCCADLRRLEASRADVAATRAELGLESRPAMVYVGKFTGWYMEQEMVDFFAVARTELPGLVFVVVTQADRAPALSALASRGIDEADYRITSTPPDNIGRFLAAASVGISFIRPCFSKISSSPTKLGEYLGAGLPVVSGPGVGDVDELLATDGVGVLVPEFNGDAYRHAARRMRQLTLDPATATRCRALAEERLSLAGVGVPRYDALYRDVAKIARQSP